MALAAISAMARGCRPICDRLVPADPEHADAAVLGHEGQRQLRWHRQKRVR